MALSALDILQLTDPDAFNLLQSIDPTLIADIDAHIANAFSTYDNIINTADFSAGDGRTLLWTGRIDNESLYGASKTWSSLDPDPSITGIAPVDAKFASIAGTAGGSQIDGQGTKVKATQAENTAVQIYENDPLNTPLTADQKAALQAYAEAKDSELWHRASEKYVRQSRGMVYALVGENPSLNTSVFYQAELPELINQMRRTVCLFGCPNFRHRPLSLQFGDSILFARRRRTREPLLDEK